MASAARNLRTTHGRVQAASAAAWVRLAAASVGIGAVCVPGCVPRNELSSYNSDESAAATGGRSPTQVEALPVRPSEPVGSPAMMHASEMRSSDGVVTAVDVARQMAVDEGPEDPASIGDVLDAPDGGDAGVLTTPAVATPAVIRALPGDGALGVTADVELILDFGRAMDTASVPGAIQTQDLALSDASFVWSEADSVLAIRLAKPLEVAAGTDPSVVEPLCYSYRITAAARDVEGLGIAPSQIRFCTERQIKQRFVALPDRLLTGNFRSDGNYGDGTCGLIGSEVCVGDSGYVSNAEYRGFLSFDARSLPTSGITLERAEVRIDIPGVRGDPLGQLDALLLERSRFDAIGAGAFADTEAQALGALSLVAGSATTWFGDAAPALLEPQTTLTQFRLRFSVATNLNGVSDHILGRADTAELLVDYRMP